MHQIIGQSVYFQEARARLHNLVSKDAETQGLQCTQQIVHGVLSRVGDKPAQQLRGAQAIKGGHGPWHRLPIDVQGATQVNEGGLKPHADYRDSAPGSVMKRNNRFCGPRFGRFPVDFSRWQRFRRAQAHFLAGSEPELVVSLHC